MLNIKQEFSVFKSAFIKHFVKEMITISGLKHMSMI